jgi:hypothetical protein
VCKWKLWRNFGQGFHVTKQENSHTNICPEIFNLWVTAERMLCRYQKQVSINMWLGFAGDCLVGPYALFYQLTDSHYWQHWQLLEDLPLAVRARMWYMHDGAPAHLSRAVWDVLMNAYHDRWRGRGGPTAWPPRSSDFNPLEFYLWGHLKALVYAAPVDNEETHPIAEACQTSSNYPGIFEQVRQSTMRGVEACIESHGGHFEHLL